MPRGTSWSWQLRTAPAEGWRARLTSSVNRPLPETSTGSSLRGTGCPIANLSRSSSVGSTKSSMLPSLESKNIATTRYRHPRESRGPGRAIETLPPWIPAFRGNDGSACDWLMTKAEQPLRVVMEDLVGIGFGQPETLDRGEGLLVLLVILQSRIVAAGHQVICPESFEGAGECGLRAVAHRIVPEFLGGDARRLGEVGMTALALTLLVEAVEQHRDRPAEMRHDELYVGIA